LENRVRNNQVIVHPPQPWVSKSYKENIDRFAIWYEEYADDYSTFMNISKESLRLKFVNKLNELIQTQEKKEPGFLKMGGSNQENTNPHDVQKDSPTLEFDSNPFNFDDSSS